MVGDCLEFYRQHGKRKERMARFVERMGIESIREALGYSPE
jgi:NAD(P)H-nitrite reductase large subunit